MAPGWSLQLKVFRNRSDRFPPAARRLPLIIGEVLVRASLQKRLVSFELITQSGVVQGRLPVAILGVYSGPHLHQLPDEPDVAAIRREVQSRPPLAVGFVQVRSSCYCFPHCRCIPNSSVLV